MSDDSPAEMLDEALGLFNEGRMGRVRRVLGRVLDQDPDNADALHLLGIVDIQRGALLSGTELIAKAIEIDGGNSAYHNNLAGAYADMSRIGEAEEHFQKAIELNPDYADAYYNIGNLYRLQGRFEEALENYRLAIEHAPGNARAANNVATVLVELGRLDEAEKAYRDALKLFPEDASMHNNLGTLYKVQNRLIDAQKAYRKVLELHPESPDGLRNLAATVKDLGQVEEGEALCLKALELYPGDALALDTLANIYMAQGRIDDALENYDAALDIVSDFAPIRGNRAMALLLKGDYEKGWEEYEWRWQSATYSATKRDFPEPRWDGKTLLLHAEQGFGDTLQFVRYASLAAERGGKVMVGCQPEMVRLLETLNGVDRVVTGEDIPDFDCHAPLVSLPHLFSTTLDSIPADVPYLRADETLSEAWKERLGDSPGLKVGLVWRGSRQNNRDAVRSCPLERFSPMLESGGVHFFSLQRDIPDDDPPLPASLTDLGSELNDFADSAACVANLDLVIAVDTAIVHLAGALGRPVWVLLPSSPDWRWLLDRDDSPWYPTARLFRQTERGDWQSVMTRIADDLGRLSDSTKK